MDRLYQKAWADWCFTDQSPSFVGAAIAACAFVIVLFLPERPLRSSHAEPAQPSE
jgi:hypothetical protein